MRKISFVLTVLCLFISLPILSVIWEGTVPYDGYRIQNVQYPSAYLNTMTQAQKDQWSPSAEWWVCTTTSPNNVFYLNSATAPTQFLFLEGTYPKWIAIFRNADRVATDVSAWTSYTANSSNNTFTIDERYYQAAKGYQYLYITAKGENDVVSLSGSISNSSRWQAVKVSSATRRYYLYNAAHGVFVKREADGSLSATSDPEQASLVELSGTMVQAMTIQFVGSSAYLGQTSGSYSNASDSWTLTPVNEGFNIHISKKEGIYTRDRYLNTSGSGVDFPYNNLTDVNRTWKFISEEEYDEKVAAILLADNQCYVRTIQAEDCVTPSSVSGGAGPVASWITELNGDFYTQAHANYVKFTSAGEMYLPVHLPRAKYAITVWQVNAADSWVNVYATTGTGAETVVYNGRTYRRVPNGHLDCRNDDGGVINAGFYTRTKNITLTATEDDYLIGLAGGYGAAFDQVVLEANEPVFCNKCYQYLICYNTDPASGNILSEYDVQAVGCDAASMSVEIPAAPAAPIGYTFSEWNTRSDGQGMPFLPGENVVLPTVHTDKYKKMSLYARWQPTAYHLTLLANGGSADGSAEVRYGAERCEAYTAVAFSAATRLKGYYTAAAGGSKVVNADGSLVAQVIGYTDRHARWTRSSNATLYAQYGPLYTISYSSATAGTIRVLDDMGNELPSGTQVVEGTVLTLQARVNDPGYQVWQWNINGNITTSSSGLRYVTVTSNTTIGVNYTVGSEQECFNSIDLQCEDEPIFLYSDYCKGTAIPSPTTIKVAKSETYVTGWTGNGYIDFGEAGATTEEYMVYYRLHIPVTGNYKVVAYGCNGGNKFIYFYAKSIDGTTFSQLDNAVLVDGDTYYQYTTQTLVGRTVGDSEWGTVMKQYPISSLNLPAGDYIVGLRARKQAKFDKIFFDYLDSDDDVFCFDKKATNVNSLPWATGMQLAHGDTLYVTPTALAGCITRVSFEVLGMDGDLFKVITRNGSSETVLLNNLVPGTYTLTLTDAIRDNGFMVVGIRSVSLGDDNNIIYGDTKGHDGIFVDGTTLMDANGVPIVLRGTNVAHVWYPERTMTALEAIASHGANSVRIVLGNGISAGDNNEQWGPTSAAEINQLINKCEELGLICILEVHNTTGKDEATSLSEAANYWVRMKDVLLDREKTVIINIGNEWMDSQDAQAWADAYKIEVAKLRAAGLRHCLMIDADGYGQGASSLASDNASEILQADPEKNIVFSLHMYQTSGGSDSNVRNNINNVIGKGLCLVIGEYGWAHKSGLYSVSVKYQTIISHTNDEQVGALSWSWYGNSGGVEYLDMVDASNNLISQTASTTAISSISADWGRYVIDNSWNWAGRSISTTYIPEHVLQIRSVKGDIDAQDYVVWDEADPKQISSASQLSVGPEHFSTAEPGDELVVFASSLATGATGQLLRTSDYSVLHSIPFTEENYSHVFTDDDIEEMRENGLVIRGQNYSIESVEIHARGCHAMRSQADTLIITTTLDALQEYKKVFDFGDWEHTLVFTPSALARLQVGDVVRVRVNASPGFALSQSRVAFRTYTNNAMVGSVNTTGQMGYTGQFCPSITNLGGGQPDRAGFVDLRIEDDDMLNRILTNGLVIFGKNARLRFFMYIHDKFVIPADTAALVPACGIDTLIIYQGGQAINQEDFQVFKTIRYVRDNVGSYSYCTFDDLDAEVSKSAGGSYTNHIDQWYTFTTPFDVTRIEAYDDDGYWDINPVWDNGGTNVPGYFYLEYLSDDNPEATNDAFRARWTKVPYCYPKAKVPYIILFSTGHGFGSYFENHSLITFTYNVPAGSPLTISGRQNAVRELPENGAHQYYLFENNTLYDMSFDGSSAYVLSDDSYEFVLTENAVVHPFECYLQATSTFKSSHPRLSFSRLDDGAVATGVEGVDALLLLNDPDTRVFDVLGREYSAHALPHGAVYILVNGSQSAKVYIP